MEGSEDTKEQSPKKQSRIWTFLTARMGLSHLSYAVPEHAQSLPYMLGGLVIGCFAILFLTGLYMAQFYNPNQLTSNESVLFLMSHALFGNFARSAHFWSANFAFGLVLLHLVRVFITGSYKRPREFTWLSGLGLLALTMAFLFTGTMLSLGQEGVEALEHNSEMGLLLGMWGTWFTAGFSASIPLIGRVYVAHISILAVLLMLFIAAHMYLIKIHGISPKANKDSVTGSTTNTGTGRFDQHLRKLFGWSLILVSIVALFSLVFPESLSSPGVAGVEATKPPWMFLWLFGMENMFGITSLIWGPALLFVLLAAIPFLDRSPYLSPKRRMKIMTYGAVIIFALVWLSLNALNTKMEMSGEGYIPTPLLQNFSLVPVAQAHNMPVVSFSPAVSMPGRTVTVSADGLKTSGEYIIYLKSPRLTVVFGTTDVAKGEDHFDADFKVPSDLPGDMYSIEVKSMQDKQFDFFAPLQLAVQPVATPVSKEEPTYTQVKIPQQELPWIVGLMLICFSAGTLLILKK